MRGGKAHRFTRNRTTWYPEAHEGPHTDAMEADVYIAEVRGFGFGAWPTGADRTVQEYGVRTLNDLLLDRTPAGRHWVKMHFYAMPFGSYPT